MVVRPFAAYLAEGPDGAGPHVYAAEVASWVDHGAGTLKFSGNPLDLALDDPNAFFEVAAPGGPLYTRQGNFRVDNRGRLVTETGLPVAGLSGEIVIGASKPVIDSSGRVLDGERLVGQLAIVHVAKPAKLERLGSGLFAPGEATPTRPEIFERVRQGHLEMTNVNAVTEMVKLMEIMRHFEFSQRIAQSYDGMLERTIRSLGEF